MDEEAMMREYTHRPSERYGSDDLDQQDYSTGFVVRGAPWSGASNGTQSKGEKKKKEEAVANAPTMDDFPTIGNGSTTRSAPVWPARKS